MRTLITLELTETEAAELREALSDYDVYIESQLDVAFAESKLAAIDDDDFDGKFDEATNLKRHQIICRSIRKMLGK